MSTPTQKQEHTPRWDVSLVPKKKKADNEATRLNGQNEKSRYADNFGAPTMSKMEYDIGCHKMKCMIEYQSLTHHQTYSRFIH